MEIAVIPGEPQEGQIVGLRRNPRTSMRAFQVQIVKIDPPPNPRARPWITVALTDHPANPIGLGYKVGETFVTINDDELVPWREPQEVPLPRYKVASGGRIEVEMPPGHPCLEYTAQGVLVLERVPKARLEAICDTLNQVARAGFESYAEEYHRRDYEAAQGDVLWRYRRDASAEAEPQVLLTDIRPRHAARLIAQACGRAFAWGSVS
ncbi:hypothetical protein [Spongiactinospora sp. TRM90649]|uniref:hypothetical protein n=1 Tax=Spongiactinospora sp. TRM90649 TaxID=3031114 RepID=UPI0023F94900|nr:hypothetical protein [Spongiactinospora sp. TRM90649]MDF5756556.1 hypothetical protein [Spongiactinospora sp. TRM90649]